MFDLRLKVLEGICLWLIILIKTYLNIANFKFISYFNFFVWKTNKKTNRNKRDFHFKCEVG